MVFEWKIHETSFDLGVVAGTTPTPPTRRGYWVGEVNISALKEESV